MLPLPLHPPVAMRVIDLARSGLNDPADPWETPGTEADLRAYGSMRRAAYAFIPADFASPELPEGAVDTLAAAVGPLTPGSVILLPQTPRSIGPKDWVVTPACVLGIGADALALWVAGPHGGIAARIPFAEVVAVIDLTVLLFGRLEIVGPEGSIVLRYNTVGRAEIRAALEVVRRSWASGAAVRGAPAGPSPDALPHKWMALLRSGEVAPRDTEPRLVAAGDVANPRASRRNGLAVLCRTEFTTVTEPDLAAGLGGYGMDLVAIPRVRLASLSAAKDGLEVRVEAGRADVALRIPAHASLVTATAARIWPAVTGAAAT